MLITNFNIYDVCFPSKINFCCSYYADYQYKAPTKHINLLIYDTRFLSKIGHNHLLINYLSSYLI